MKKVKWGVLGAGGIADRRTLPGMMLCENAEVTAVMEVDPANAERLRDKYGAKSAYTTAEALIADPEVEAVYIASPINFHKSQVFAAAKAGKHILCEKPIALTVAECEEIENFCKNYDVLTATGFMMRFHAYHQQIKKLISDGAIGQLVTARAQFTCWYPEIEGAWRQKKALSGGGALMDLGVHCIDLVEYLSGQRTVKTAAFCDTKTFNYDVEDTANVILKLDGGLTAYVDVNFNIPDEAAICRLEFYGTKGSIFAEGTLGQEESGEVKVIISDQAGYDAAQTRGETKSSTLTCELGNMYTKEIDAFSDSILNGTEVEVPMADAVHVQRVVEAAYRSAEEEKFIEVK